MTSDQKKKVASSNGVKPRFVYEVLAGDKFTTNPGLAIDLAKFTGKKPIDYFNPRNKFVRRLALEVHPELNVKPIVHKHRVSVKA